MAKAGSAKKDIQVVGNDRQLETRPDISPSTFVQDAIAKGASVEVLEKLLGLQERFEANQARKAFDNAMADVRGELPDIIKNRRVDFNQTHYAYEDLSSVVEALAPVLSKHGLSFRWRTESHEDTSVTVTCILSHRDGHSEMTALTAAPDNSGQKNAIQQLGSAVTYLQRYTLKAAIGVASGVDDDGRASGPVQGAGNTGQQPQNPQQATNQQPRPVQRSKHPHCQAHTDLGEAIKKYCAERPAAEASKVLEEVTTLIQGNTVTAGVKDVLLLSEGEAKTALGRLKAISAARPATGATDTTRNYAKELGMAVVGYVTAHKEDFKNKETGETGEKELSAGNFLVLEDVTGMKNLAAGDRSKLWSETITPEIAKKALEKFEREYRGK